MLWVFERQLDFAWRNGGTAAVARVGWLGLRDLFTVAFPSQVVSERSVASAAAALITSAIFIFLIAVMQDPAFAGIISSSSPAAEAG